MKTIKIIDLLNKIANGEAPRTIFYMGSTYDYDKDCMDYEDVDTGDLMFDDRYNTQILNDEVEILDKEYIGKQSIEDTIKYIQVGMKGIIKEKELIKNYSKDEFEDIEYYDLDNFKYIHRQMKTIIKNQKKIIERLNNESRKKNDE